MPGEIGVGSHGELLICPESGIKREKQGQNLKGQRVHFTVQKGDGLKQAGRVVQMVKNPLAMQETRVPSPSGEDPLEEGTAAHSGILAWRIPVDRGAWWATVHGVTELDTTEQLHFKIFSAVANTLP